MKKILENKKFLLLGALLGLSAYFAAYVVGRILPPQIMLAFVGNDNFAGMSSFMIVHIGQIFSLIVLIPFWLLVFKRLMVGHPGLSAATSLVMIDVLYNLISLGFLPILEISLQSWGISLLVYLLVGAVVTPVLVQFFSATKNETRILLVALAIFGIVPFALHAFTLYLRSSV